MIFTPASGPEQGVAGLAMRPNVNRLANGDKLNGVRATTFLRQNLTYSPGQVVWSAALCEQQSLATPNTSAAIIFARWTGTIFNIYAAHGSSANCLAALNGVGVSATLIDTVPLGHNWFHAVTQDKFGAIHYTSADLTTDQVATDTFGGFDFVRFTRGFDGTAADTSHLTTPLSDTLAVDRSTAFRDTDTGIWTAPERANLTRLVGNRRGVLHQRRGQRRDPLTATDRARRGAGADGRPVLLIR